MTRLIDPEGDAVHVVYEPPPSAAREVTKHIVWAVAAAWEPKLEFDTPAAVIGELRGEADGTERSYEWRAEAAWLKRPLAGEWDEERLLTETFEDAEDFSVVDDE